MRVGDLRDVPIERLLDAFNDAFSGYVVPMKMTAESLGHSLRRGAYEPRLSVGAFEAVEGAELLVGFVCNGLDGRTAYNAGTGVRPAYRHRRLGHELMEHAIETLRGAADRYVLEVIDSNAPAERLYRGLGFAVTRGLQCWNYEPPRGVELPRVADTSALEAHADVAPAWQNTLAAVRRAGGEVVTLGDERGCVVVTASGNVPWLVVHREHRRRGLGRLLLDAAATTAKKPLRILNVDERDAGVAAFLDAAGAKRQVRQLEMDRSLR